MPGIWGSLVEVGLVVVLVGGWVVVEVVVVVTVVADAEVEVDVDVDTDVDVEVEAVDVLGGSSVTVPITQ